LNKSENGSKEETELFGFAKKGATHSYNIAHYRDSLSSHKENIFLSRFFFHISMLLLLLLLWQN